MFENNIEFIAIKLFDITKTSSSFISIINKNLETTHNSDYNYFGMLLYQNIVIGRTGYLS